MQGAFGEGLGQTGLEKDGFFLLEDRKIRRLLLLCLRVLVPALSSQNPCQDREHPSSLCLPLGSFQAGTRRATGRAGHCHRHSGPPSPGRGVCEENKENPACLGSWKSEDDFHTRVPGKPNDSLLSSQLAVWFFWGRWELTSAQQLEHQPRLEEVEDMHPPTSPQAHSTTLSTRAERDTWEASH